jgi:hypothetical protein
MVDFELHNRFSGIVELQDTEIDQVSAGRAAADRVAARVFGGLGIFQTIIWAGERAYEVGRWIGRQ